MQKSTLDADTEYEKIIEKHGIKKFSPLSQFFQFGPERFQWKPPSSFQGPLLPLP